MHLDTDRTNEIAKRIIHRFIAREVREDPSLITRARAELLRLERDRGFHPWMTEWNDILKKPQEEVSELPTRRSERMDRLRISSPFTSLRGRKYELSEEQLRHRIWRASKRLLSLAKSRENEEVNHSPK